MRHVGEIKQNWWSDGMTDGAEITFYCEHVAPNHVHCNRYIVVTNVEPYETPQNMIEDIEWEYVDGEARCPQHAE